MPAPEGYPIMGGAFAQSQVIYSKWLLNFDVRWIQIETDATLFDGTDAEIFPLDINPLVYSINIGYMF
jgi:outer membrane protein W